MVRSGLCGRACRHRRRRADPRPGRRPEGGAFRILLHPGPDDAGRILGLFRLYAETTEQLLAARQLAAERDQFAQLFEQAPTFMAMLRGPDHRIELANPGYMQLVGHRPVLGRTVAEALPDAVEQGYLDLLDRVFASGEAFAANAAKYAVQTQPGAPVTESFVDFVYQPIKDSSGQVTGIFVEGADVTERAAADAALRESEARLRELNADLERRVIERAQARGRTWRVSPDLLGALNSKGYFETSNPAWQTVLGWSEAEVASMSIFELLHPEDVERTRVGFELTQQGQPMARQLAWPVSDTTRWPVGLAVGRA